VHLRTVLAKMRLTSGAIESVMDSVGKKDFQVACRRQFEARFPAFPAHNVGNHPNAYIEDAQKAIKEATAAAGGAGAAAAAPAAAPGFASASAPTATKPGAEPAGVIAPASAAPAAGGAGGGDGDAMAIDE
jgi:hypothetical protein